MGIGICLLFGSDGGGDIFHAQEPDLPFGIDREKYYIINKYLGLHVDGRRLL